MTKSLEPLSASPVRIGIDVSQDELAIARSDCEAVETVRNKHRAIARWLTTLPSGSRLALEATGRYHRLMAEMAYAQGHTVYLLDGFRLNRYRDSIGGRAKTDDGDARLVLRYLTNEGKDLRPWTPPPAGYTRVQSLLRRRALLVQTRTALRQSLGDVPELKTALKRLERSIIQVEHLIEKRLTEGLKELGWWPHVRRCQAVEGIGPLTAMALANTFHRGAFSGRDAFIAFLGLDVRVRDSGKKVGQRKLTKKGDPELRRLLYNAAMAASRTERWREIYQGYLARGLKTTQALVVLARKLARIAFALMKNQADYSPKMA